MALSKLERETLICYNEEEDTVDIQTYHSKVKIKLIKAAEQYPDSVTEWKPANKYGGVFYHIPKKWLTVNIAPPRLLTDEQREAMSQRLKPYHFNSEPKNALSDEGLNDKH